MEPKLAQTGVAVVGGGIAGLGSHAAPLLPPTLAWISVANVLALVSLGRTPTTLVLRFTSEKPRNAPSLGCSYLTSAKRSCERISMTWYGEFVDNR
jgi:hypothetical protein